MQPLEPDTTEQIRRRAAIILPLAALLVPTAWVVILRTGQVDWTRMALQSPLAVDGSDPVIFAVAGAVTVLVCAAIVATNRPPRRPSRWRRWLTRGVLTLAAVGSAIAVTAAVLPGRPAMAAASSFDARTATADALIALVDDYRPDAGVWDTIDGPGWWQSAVALDDLIAAERALGTHAEDWVLEQSYQQTPDTYDHKIIRWRGPYYDDSAWWGIAWLDAYTWTGQRRYLTAAQGVADYLEQGRTASCGGGVEWGTSWIHHGDEKNAITNELTVALDAGLYQVTHRPADLHRALASWRWLRGTGLIRPGRMVADHLDTHCRAIGVRWSYTQGEAIRGALALADATGDEGYAATAAGIADAATASPALNPGGVFREPCAPRLCGHNGAFFAGPYATSLAELSGHDAYLARQATTAYAHDRAADDQYGLMWSGPIDRTSSGRQASAAALLAAAITGGQS